MTKLREVSQVISDYTKHTCADGHIDDLETHVSQLVEDHSHPPNILSRFQAPPAANLLSREIFLCFSKNL
jgi:hypothetical protein